ncbi:MAG: Clp protease N-terminal domain-containing protein [Acidimicrobiales bacterium]
MFERFTDRARRVVVLAQEEARALHHDYIGTEHLLLGLMHEGEGVAARALDQIGVSLDVARAKVLAITGEAAGVPDGHIPFTPRAKKVLELSLREALQLGHNYIGTEHILLGLIREGEGVGAQVLMTLGADLAAVRQAVIQRMSAAEAGRPGATFVPPGRLSRVTPAAAKAEVEARRMAAGSPVGSHHLLLAMVQQQDSMAAKVLEDLGVTAEALQERLAQIEPAGTSDETPEEAGARRVGLRVEGKLVMLEIDDPELAASLEKAMTGRKVRVIRGTDPEAEGAGFPNVWSAVARSIEDMTRRLGKVAGAARAATSGPAAYWRPPELDPMASAARYWMVSQPGGTHGYLEVGPGTGWEEVRAWLGAWLVENRSSLARPGGPSEEGGAAVLWLAVDAEGEAFTVRDVGFGPAGPPDSRPLPLEALVDAAVADLSAVT